MLILFVGHPHSIPSAPVRSWRGLGVSAFMPLRASTSFRLAHDDLLIKFESHCLILRSRPLQEG